MVYQIATLVAIYQAGPRALEKHAVGQEVFVGLLQDELQGNGPTLVLGLKEAGNGCFGKGCMTGFTL